MSYAVMPLTDYKDMCDKVREKTESTDTIKSGEMPSKIEEVYEAGKAAGGDTEAAYKAGQLNVLSSAECLQGNKSGAVVGIADISPIEHTVGVLVEHPETGVNLLEGKAFYDTPSGSYNDMFLCSDFFYLEAGQEYVLNSTTIVSADIGMEGFPDISAPFYATEFPFHFTPTESGEYRLYCSLGTDASDVSLMVLGYAPSANEKVYVGGANLLNLDRTLGTLKSGQTGKRTDFEFDKYYEGITRTNINVGSAYATATIENNVITVNTRKAYYGIGIPFKVKPNTSYIYSSRGGVTGSPYIRVSLYTEDGTFLKDVSPYPFVTPENCTVAMLSIAGQTDNSVVTVTNPQIEADTTIHEYEPYIEPTEYTTNAEGVIEGLKNRYPSMSFSTESEDTTITVNYYKDIDKVFAELNTAIALTGGN